MSKEVGERLKEVRIGLGYGTQESFAAKIGTTQTTLSKYEKGTNELPDDIKLKISQFGINLHWLITGQGEMRIQATPGLVTPIDRPNVPKVPLLRQKVSCGAGQEWETEDNIVDYIDIFGGYFGLSIQRLFALCVEGSSMSGAGIQSGDYVLFDAAHDQALRDGIYVFVLDGEVFCKRLEFDMTKIRVFSVRFTDLDKADLMATLDTQDAATADRFRIFGRVKYWVHPHEVGVK